MYRKVSLLVLILLSVLNVTAGNNDTFVEELFPFFRDLVLDIDDSSNKKERVQEEILEEIPKNIEEIVIETEEISPVEILITEKGFEPAKVVVKAGQSVVWHNERPRLRALVIGVYKSAGIDSGFLKPGRSFMMDFREVGEYKYVDGVVIGLVGKVVVE